MDYDYFKSKYETAKYYETSGILMTFVGAGLSVAGYLMNNDKKEVNDNFGKVSFYGGIVVANGQ